jgi:hypothetical protein
MVKTNGKKCDHRICNPNNSHLGESSNHQMSKNKILKYYSNI